MSNPPFDNCKYKICDLPGQCLSEGKCHHPEQKRIADLERQSQEHLQFQSRQAAAIRKHVKRIAELERQLAKRDTDWVLAIGSALGLESGFDVPIVPKPEVFKRLFKQIEKHRIADLKRQLAEARQDAERLRVAIVEFYNDWQKGDFDLPELAQLDLRSVMDKAGYGGLLDKFDAAITDHPE